MRQSTMTDQSTEWRALSKTNETPTMTESSARVEFSQYFTDLRASMKAEGGAVNKAEEWARFIAQSIEDGLAPKEAVKWKYPRSRTRCEP